MGFEVRSTVLYRVHTGQIIQYSIRPLFGIAADWVTEITHVEEGRLLVDEQRFGPRSGIICTASSQLSTVR